MRRGPSPDHLDAAGEIGSSRRPMSDSKNKLPKTIPISKMLADQEDMGWGDPAFANVVCPLCQFHCTHTDGVRTVRGDDDHKAGWGGRGDLVVVSMWGECGHRWELCIGFHKGNQAIFTRVHTTESSETLPPGVPLG